MLRKAGLIAFKAIIPSGYSMPKPEQIDKPRCPDCAGSGRKVGRATLESLLRPERCAAAGGGPYFVCRAATCDTVYFSSADRPRFVKSDLTVRFGLKENQPPRPVCYCFDHTIEGIHDEIRSTGRSTVLDRIRERIRAEGCRCAYTNPLGRCCLESVQEVVAEALQQAGREDEAGAAAGQDHGDCCSDTDHSAERGAVTDCCTKEREREQLGAAAPPGCCQPHDAVGARSGRDGAGALAAGGSVLAAILSSACCWLPLLLIAFGASAAGVAGFFETYRPYFLAGAISLLGLGFYTVYVRHGECEPGSACARPKRKLRVFNRLMLWTATVLVTAFSFFPSYVGRVFGPSSRPSSEADHGGFATAAFAIEGMTCEGCATTLSTVLVNLPGVRAARVDFEAKTAFVQFEPDRPLPADRVIEAVRAAGFTAASSDQSP